MRNELVSVRMNQNRTVVTINFLHGNSDQSWVMHITTLSALEFAQQIINICTPREDSFDMELRSVDMGR
jgi:regulation of enolase protein 1 (concanavalin A-like superfamily)